MTEEEFVAISREKYQELQKLNEIKSFYDYEKAFDGIWTEFGRQSLEKNIGDLPENHQKKTTSEPDTEK
jgi:hypothetical protein